MVILLLRGGLGNQLFIYGKYKSLEKLGKVAFIDDIFGFKSDKLFKRINMLNHLSLEYKNIFFKCDIFWKLLSLINDNTTIGIFSNKYFQESIFLDNVSLKFTNIFPRICVHIRLKNYSLCIQEHIYLTMLSSVIDKNQNYPVYFITDDEIQFKSTMPVLYDKGICINLSEIQAFSFIAESCEVILSDSSFSFCAAYLGPPKKITYKQLTNILNNGKNEHQWVKF